MHTISVNVAGVKVAAIDLPTAVKLISQWVSERKRTYVYLCSIHSVVCCLQDNNLRRAFNRAGLVTPDGMPIVWICQCHGQRSTTRVYGPDLMLAICESSQATGFHHFFYGGAPRVADRLAAALKSRYPALSVVGTWCPSFCGLTADEDCEVIKHINASGADIVWVGLGCPKQERWIAEHRRRLTSPVLVGVGYAFDVHSGTKSQAPLWMQSAGLEWLFRLIQAPRKTFPRVFVEGPIFSSALLRQILGLRNFPIEDGDQILSDSQAHSTFADNENSREG